MDAKPDNPSPLVSPLRAGIAGTLAGAIALSAGELAGSLVAPRPGPVFAVANRVIDYAPVWFVNFGKAIFGLADKPALVLGTIIISLAISGGLGVASRRSLKPALLGITGFGLIGIWAIGIDAQGGWGSAIPVGLVAIVSGVAALVALMAKAQVGTAAGDPATTNSPTKADGDSEVIAPIDSPIDPAVSRRGFLNLAGAVGATAAVATVGGNILRSRSSAADARAAVQLDSSSENTELGVLIAEATTGDVGATPGISPLVVPNDDFYLIDTAILTPQVDPNDWQLTITGMVDKPITISYQDLLDRATTIEPVTLSCVSNEVGGTLVGNAIWQGVPLADLLDEAGVQQGATQIASRSVDGWTCGFPTEAAYDGRTAMVAIGMNDEPLPLRHGFPARLVVSGLYGYVSATKWLSEIELTTLEDFDGYWIPRGWSKSGPVKTQSRIDTPRHGSSVTAGDIVPIAGVAWAPNIGIEKVEVQIGEQGEWIEAELGESLGANAWRQWLVPWQASSGEYLIQVRATDASGYTQTSTYAPPAPNGASGWHRIAVRAT